MIRIKYKKYGNYNFETHSFPEYVDSLESIIVYDIGYETSYETEGLFCISGCGTFAEWHINSMIKAPKIVSLSIRGYTINNIDTYNYDLKRYYTCNELVVKSILL